MSRALIVRLFLFTGIALWLAGALSTYARAAKSEASGRAQAPVGHRQPTARDVPQEDTSVDQATRRLIKNWTVSSRAFAGGVSDVRVIVSWGARARVSPSEALSLLTLVAIR